MPPRRRASFLLVGGSALIIVGGAVLAFAPTNEFGAFAYAPLSEAVFRPGVLLGTTHLSGAAALGAGLVASSWAMGYLAGRRADKRR